jgi:hypothetical protein
MRRFIRKTTPAVLACIAFLTTAGFREKGTGSWKEKQLIRPEILAARIGDGTASNVLILNTGPVEDIKGAVNIGAVEDAHRLEKFRNYVDTVSRDRELIIYCGCCPLEVCPNLKPAYDILKQKKFKNFKILRLTQDLQEDWIDKGYPVQ